MLNFELCRFRFSSESEQRLIVLLLTLNSFFNTFIGSFSIYTLVSDVFPKNNRAPVRIEHGKIRDSFMVTSTTPRIQFNELYFLIETNL